MGTLEIHCHSCGAVYEVLPDCIVSADKLPEWIRPYRCPHCMAEMNTRTWDKLATAFWTLWEVNKELLEWHAGYDNHPLMQAQIKNHYVPQKDILHKE